MRELERRSGLALGTVQQELKKLVGMELLEARKDGNRVYYSANAWQSNISSVNWGHGSRALHVDVDAPGFPRLVDLDDYRRHQSQ